MKFDIDEFNDKLTGHFMLDSIMLGKDSCRWRPWQLVYIRLVLTLRWIHFLATQCIYVFVHILKSKSDNFHIHHSPIGLSDDNTVSTARYELRLYMCMQFPISLRNEVPLYVVRLFASFLVWDLEICRRHEFFSVYLGFPLSVSFKIINLIKQIKNKNYTIFVLISTMPGFLN
jgi:hypothetical protein